MSLPLLYEFILLIKLYPLRASEKACKRGIHPGFETQGRRHQKSKTGVPMGPQSTLLYFKNFKEKL